MVAGLDRDRLGLSRFYYLGVSLDETLRRHATRPQAAEFGPDDMRACHRPGDLLSGIDEHVIHETSTLREATSLILAETRLLRAGAARSGA
jgi:hypothetical protein